MSASGDENCPPPSSFIVSNFAIKSPSPPSVLGPSNNSQRMASFLSPRHIPKPSEDSMETSQMMPQVRKKLINPSKCIGSNSDSSSKSYVSISNVDEMGENIAEYVEVTEVNFTSTISKLADGNNNTNVINNADENVDDIDNTDINKTDNNADVTSTNDINNVINVDNANNDFNYNVIVDNINASVDNINASVGNMTIDENIKKFDAYNNNIGPSTDFKESTMSPSSSSEFSQSNNKFTNEHDNNRNNRMTGDRVQNLALHGGIEVSALTKTLLQRSNEQQQQQCINYKLQTDEFMKMIDDIVGSCDNVNDNTSKDEALHSDVDACTKLFERLSVCNSDLNDFNVNDVNNSTGPNKVDTNNSIDANKIDVDNLIDANKIVVGNLVDPEKNDVDSFFDSVILEDGVINIEPPISKNYIDDNSKNCFKEYNVKDVDGDSPNDSYNECFIINKSNQPAATEHQIGTTNCNIDNNIKDITNDNNNNDNSHNNNASSNIENDNNDASSNDDCNNFVTNSLPTVKKSFTKDFEGLDMNSDPSRLGFDVVSKTDNDDGDIHIADVLSSDMNVGCMEVEECGGEEKVKKLGGLINRTFGEMDDNNDGTGRLSSSEIRSDDVVKFNEMRMDDDSKIVEVIHTTVYERKDEIYDSAGAVGSVDNTGDSKCNVEDIRENIFVSNSPPITKKIVAIDFDKLDIDSDPTKLTGMLTDGVLSQYGTNQTGDVDKMKRHCGFVSNSDGVSMNNFEIVNNEKKNHISPDDTKKLFNTTLKQLSCENKCHKNNNFKGDDEVPISPAAVVNKPTGMNMPSNFNACVLKLSTEQLETAADQKEAFAESRPSSLRSSSPALMPPTHPIINWDHIDEHSDPALFCKSSSSSFIINTNNSGDNYKNKNDDDYDDKGTTKDNFKTLSPTKVTEKRTAMKKKSVGPPRHAKDGEKKCAAECSARTTDNKLESKKPPVKRFQRPVNLTKLTGSAVGKNNCNDDEDVLIFLPSSKNSLITSSTTTTTTPSTMTSSAMAKTSFSSPSSHLKNVDSINIGEVNVDNQLDRVQQSDSNSLNHFASSSFLDTSLSFDTIKGSDGNLSISSIEPSSLNPVLCSSILESDLQITCVKLSDDSIPNDTINSCNDVINDNSNNSGNISNNVSNINRLDISRSSNRKMNVMNFSVEEMKNFLKLPGPAITTFAATTAATADGATDTNVDICDRTLCENDASMQQTGVVELSSVLINEREGKPTFKSASEVFGDPTQWDVLEKYTSKMSDDSVLVRESLYVRFDPLVSKPIKPENLTSKRFFKEPSILSTSECSGTNDLLLLTSPPDRQQSHNNNEITTTSKTSTNISKADLNNASSDEAYASKVDRIFESSPPTSKILNLAYPICVSEEDVDTSLQVLKYSQTDLNKKLKEFELHYQAKMLRVERNWALKLQNMKEEHSKLETLHNEEIKKKNDEIDKLLEKGLVLKNVMHEYEEVMNRLIIENEKSKESCNGVMVDLRRERDQALDDLQSVETAFSDLHKRYEKCKSVVDAYRKNEETLKSCMLDYQEKLVKNDEKYKSFKQMAEQKINLANAEIDKVKKSSDSEIKVLQIAIRKLEMKAEGLQKSIEQKTLENTELTAICDELLSKAK